MVRFCAKSLSVMTSSRPPWLLAHTSGTFFSGGESWPSAETMRMRPGRSVTSSLPSPRKASAQGCTRPLAKVCTSSCPAEDWNDVLCPRVPVTSKNVPASSVAAESAIVTSPKGVFIMVGSRLLGSRAQLVRETGRRSVGSHRDRHRRDLDRQHLQGGDQTQRGGAERERSRDGVDQSGRGNGRGPAGEAGGAGRPDHGPIP